MFCGTQRVCVMVAHRSDVFFISSYNASPFCFNRPHQTSLPLRPCAFTKIRRVSCKTYPGAKRTMPVFHSPCPDAAA